MLALSSSVHHGLLLSRVRALKHSFFSLHSMFFLIGSFGFMMAVPPMLSLAHRLYVRFVHREECAGAVHD
jgi:hypothetical protein